MKEIEKFLEYCKIDYIKSDDKKINKEMNFFTKFKGFKNILFFFLIILSYMILNFITDQFFQLGYLSSVWFYIIFFSLIINITFLSFSIFLSKYISYVMLPYNLKKRYSKFLNIFFCLIILYILPMPVLNCYNAIKLNMNYQQTHSQEEQLNFKTEYKKLNEKNIFINMFKTGTLENNIIFSKNPNFKNFIKEKDFTSYFINESLEDRYRCVGDCDYDSNHDIIDGAVGSVL